MALLLSDEARFAQLQSNLSGAPGTIANGGISNTDAHISSYNYLDLSAAVKLADKITLRVGCNNILDKDPPVIGDHQPAEHGGQRQHLPSGVRCIGSIHLRPNHRAVLNGELRRFDGGPQARRFFWCARQGALIGSAPDDLNPIRPYCGRPCGRLHLFFLEVFVQDLIADLDAKVFARSAFQFKHSEFRGGGPDDGV